MSSRVFILRDFDGQIHAYVVPYRNGAYWLPELDWSRPAIPCASFGPDNTDGELDKGGAFGCWLSDYGGFFAENIRSRMQARVLAIEAPI